MDLTPFTNVLVSATFFASLIAALTNIVITVINNTRLKNIENQKYVNEMKSTLLIELIKLHKEWVDALRKIEYSGTPVWENKMTRLDTNKLFLKKMKIFINNHDFWDYVANNVDSDENKVLHLNVLTAMLNGDEMDEKEKYDASQAFITLIEITNELEGKIDEVFKEEIYKTLSGA